MKEQLRKITFLVTLKRKYNELVMEILSRISVKWASKRYYRRSLGKKLDLRHPKTFNEKLNWLKVYKFGEREVMCADKARMHEYVEAKGCPEILVELLHTYDHEKEIDWSVLPDKFVLKPNNSFGKVIICQDKSKLNIQEAMETMKTWRKTSFGYQTAEIHYTKIKFKIVCEKYIESNEVIPMDYKFYCFYGEPKHVMVAANRDVKVEYYYLDLDWTVIPIAQECYKDPNRVLVKPKSFQQMIDYCRIVAADFDFVRMDFYDGDPYPILGEMTFTPSACSAPGYSEYGNKVLSEYFGEMRK